MDISHGFYVLNYNNDSFNTKNPTNFTVKAWLFMEAVIFLRILFSKWLITMFVKSRNCLAYNNKPNHDTYITVNASIFM